MGNGKMGTLRERWAISHALLGECLPLELMVPEMRRLDITYNLEQKLHIHAMNPMTGQVSILAYLRF